MDIKDKEGQNRVKLESGNASDSYLRDTVFELRPWTHYRDWKFSFKSEVFCIVTQCNFMVE
jgi:hypothetical protein